MKSSIVGGPRLARSAGLAALLLLVGASDLFAQGPPGPPGGGRPPVGGNLNLPPTISGLTGTQIANQYFVISGYVTDENKVNCTVTISGSAQGSMSVNSLGYFSGTFSVPTLGGISAVANDGTQNGPSVSSTLTNAAPTVVVGAAQGDGTWIFSGTVGDAAPQGLTVTLTGLPGGTISTVAGAGGAYSFTVTLEPGASGQVTASVTDWYGLSGSGTTYFGS